MLYAAKYYWPGVTQAGLEQASDRLGIPCERLMEPIWLPPDQPIPEGAQK
jgi:hypothetical protein